MKRVILVCVLFLLTTVGFSQETAAEKAAKAKTEKAAAKKAKATKTKAANADK